MNINEIRERLFKVSDKKYGEFNSKLCPDTNRKIIGVRIPELRKIAKEIANNQNSYDYLNDVIEEKEEYFEEVLLQGLVIAYKKMDLETKLEYTKKFVPKIDSWAISDTFIPTFKFKEKDLDAVWKFILPYAGSNQEFEVRFAVIMMLDYFINDMHVDKVINVIDGIKCDKYYAQMAMAWTIAEIGIKYNEKAMVYLKSENNLDKFTFNKSLQKMIESYRIKEGEKDMLRKMKRK